MTKLQKLEFERQLEEKRRLEEETKKHQYQNRIRKSVNSRRSGINLRSDGGDGALARKVRTKKSTSYEIEKRD